MLQEQERKDNGVRSSTSVQEKSTVQSRPGKLSYMDQREYDQMEKRSWILKNVWRS
jgi:hypothetical protein